MAVFEDGELETPAKPFEDPSAVKLEDLVGEGKKFATEADLVKSWAHGQNHISDLELTQARIAKKADQTEAVEQLLEELRNKPAESGTPASNTQPEPEANAQPTPETQQGRSIEDIVAKVRDQLSQETAQATAEQNAAKVRNALTDAYGSGAQIKFQEKLSQLGLSVEQANALASENPDVVIKMLELPAAPAPTAEVTRYNITPENKTDTDSTLEELNELRRTNFREWLKPANQRKLNALVRAQTS